MSRVVVGLVFHSEPELLRRCLASISRDWLFDTPIRIVVWDTSSGGEARILASEFGALWHDGSRNAGYAWAMNGIVSTYADPVDICVLGNSDIVFLEGSVEALAAYASRGYVCYPVQLVSDNQAAEYTLHRALSRSDMLSRWMGIGRRRRVRNARSLIQKALSAGTPTPLCHCLVGSGALIAAPASLWAELGGMNEQFFLFEEDREFGSRCHRAGVGTLLCGDAKIVHSGGVRSRPRSRYMMSEAALSERIAWLSLFGRLPLWVPIVQLVGCASRVVVSVSFGRWADAGTFARTLVDIMRIGGVGAPVGSDGYRVPLLRGVDK